MIFDSTSRFIVVYGIKHKGTIGKYPYWIISVALLLIPVLTLLLVFGSLEDCQKIISRQAALINCCNSSTVIFPSAIA